MWFLKNLTKPIQIGPSNLNEDILTHVIDGLRTRYEGHFDNDTGSFIIVAPLREEQVILSPGRVLDDGSALFSVSFEALVLKPLKGQVVDTRISKLTVQEGVDYGRCAVTVSLSIGPIMGSVFLSNCYRLDAGARPRKDHWVLEDDGISGPRLTLHKYDPEEQKYHEVCLPRQRNPIRVTFSHLHFRSLTKRSRMAARCESASGV